MAQKKKTPLPAADGELIITVRNGNLNGDPAEDGNPRMNSWTDLGMVSGECIKRKVRDFIFRHWGHEEGYDLFVSRAAVHETKIREAYVAAGALDEKGKLTSSEKGNDALIQRYFDIRLFGQVINKPGEGRLRGPLSVDIGESVYPIPLEDVQGTRVSTATEARSEKQQGRNQEFTFRKIVTFAVYRVRWHFDPFQAVAHNVSQLDYDRFIEALNKAFRGDHSSMRGEVTLRKHFVFEHDDPTRCAEPVELYERIQVEADDPENAFNWSCYRVSLPDPETLPKGVTLRVLKD